MKKPEEKTFIPKIKDVKMNIKIDEPTMNGHIYKKDMLEKALRDALNTRLSINITRNSDELVGLYMQDPSKVIGKLKDFEIREDGDIILKIMPTLETDLFDLFLATPMVTGVIDKDRAVNIYSIVGFFLANRDDKILEVEGKE